MTLPMMLDEPPVVIQSAQSCYAAAFESWSDATARLTGTTNPINAERLISWLESGNGLLLPSGRAHETRGRAFVHGVGLMDTETLFARQLTVELLAERLELGYLYITYLRRPRAPAHVVVCYGVDARNIYLMDPYPGRGLITREAGFFTSMSEGAASIGTSYTLALSRSVGESLSGVGP